ncbi:hypothetical protein DEO72_LG6g808 [Vigna unguiculata]|uniref:Uncharacterized protein n=1 Tax=Vigna unguiculata TaxID=3917 RepID=A0A4D6M7M3_VIGUN|nr:hypothetical protein DEO72_LG6g808 [Vigna unguiculata]
MGDVYKRQKEGKIPIWGVQPNGTPILTNKINGHFIWDADPDMCDPDCDCHHDYGDSSEEEEEEDDGKPGGGPCKPSPPPYDKSPPADRPWIGLHQQNLPDPFWKQRRCLEILGRYPSPPRIPLPCMMFTKTNYESEFPSLERQVDPVSNIATKPNISPTEVGPEGRLKPLTQAEEVDPVSNIATKPNISPTEAGPEGRLKPLTQAEEMNLSMISIRKKNKEIPSLTFSWPTPRPRGKNRSTNLQKKKKMTGTLKEWYHNLGAVRQDQFHTLGSTAAVLGALHEEFIGDGAITDRKIRQEFFEMKCCSLSMKDLDRHFKRMIQRFYLLNGGNDPSLKNTYVASLLVDLQPELNRMAIAAQKDFSHMTMGQIHQMTNPLLYLQFFQPLINYINKKTKNN